MLRTKASKQIGQHINRIKGLAGQWPIVDENNIVIGFMPCLEDPDDTDHFPSFIFLDDELKEIDGCSTDEFLDIVRAVRFDEDEEELIKGMSPEEEIENPLEEEEKY